MNNQTAAADPLDQVLTQVRLESGNEDLSIDTVENHTLTISPPR